MVRTSESSSRMGKMDQEFPGVGSAPHPDTVKARLARRRFNHWWYTRAEACRQFGISRGVFDMHVNAGHIKHVPVRELVAQGYTVGRGTEGRRYPAEQISRALGRTELHPDAAKWEHDCRTRPETGRELRARYKAKPDEWVYICKNADDEIIYVGVTSSGLGRFSVHRHGSPWFREVMSVDIEHYGSRAESERREAELINELRPRYNRAIPPVPA